MKKQKKDYLKPADNFPMNAPETNISDMKLSDIASMPGITLGMDTDRKELKIRQKNADGIKSYKHQVSNTGRRTTKVTDVPLRDSKKDYLQDIWEMKAAGEKQKDIADALGMSQGYVSRLLKKHKKK